MVHTVAVYHLPSGNQAYDDWAERVTPVSAAAPNERHASSRNNADRKSSCGVEGIASRDLPRGGLAEVRHGAAMQSPNDLKAVDRLAVIGRVDTLSCEIGVSENTLQVGTGKVIYPVICHSREPALVGKAQVVRENESVTKLAYFLKKSTMVPDVLENTAADHVSEPAAHAWILSLIEVAHDHVGSALHEIAGLIEASIGQMGLQSLCTASEVDHRAPRRNH